MREASQYAWAVVSEWQAKIGIHRTGLAGLLHSESSSAPGRAGAAGVMLAERSKSFMSMQQLRRKQPRPGPRTHGRGPAS